MPVSAHGTDGKGRGSHLPDDAFQGGQNTYAGKVCALFDRVSEQLTFRDRGSMKLVNDHL